MAGPRPETRDAVEKGLARALGVAGPVHVDVPQQKAALVLEIEAADEAVAGRGLDHDGDAVQLAAIVVEGAHYEVAAATAQNFWKAPIRSRATSSAVRPSMR